jgi:hypothetical protein
MSRRWSEFSILGLANWLLRESQCLRRVVRIFGVSFWCFCEPQLTVGYRLYLVLHDKVSTAWKTVHERIADERVATGQMSPEEAKEEYMSSVRYVCRKILEWEARSPLGDSCSKEPIFVLIVGFLFAWQGAIYLRCQL